MCQEAETALAWLPVAVNDPERNFAAARFRRLTSGHNQASIGSVRSFDCGSLRALFRGRASGASIEHQ
jgi:hypothetical protein